LNISLMTKPKQAFRYEFATTASPFPYASYRETTRSPHAAARTPRRCPRCCHPTPRFAGATRGSSPGRLLPVQGRVKKNNPVLATRFSFSLPCCGGREEKWKKSRLAHYNVGSTAWII
jgi:hypothetical protein